MKKVIDGKIYNTDTATEVEYYSNYSTGFDNYNETLYLTKKGVWFLHGSGGPMSPYAVSYPGGSSGGDDIIVYSNDEAFAWLEKHNKIDAIEKYFPGEIEEA
jgi:hypothetical protein